jgi:hypothetical protein
MVIFSCIVCGMRRANIAMRTKPPDLGYFDAPQP